MKNTLTNPRRLVIAQVWALIIALPALSRTITPLGSYMHHWSRGSVLVPLFCVVTLGFLIQLSASSLRELSPRWFCRLAPVSAVLAVMAVAWRLAVHHSSGQGFSERLESMFPVYAATMLLLSIAAVVISFRRRWSFESWTAGTGRLSMFLSPLLVIFWLNTFLLPMHPAAPEQNLIASGIDPRQTVHDNVFIFVLDAWPYRVACDENGFRPELKNLNELSQTSWRFTDAHSPSINTLTSMPGLIYQRMDAYGFAGFQPGFMLRDENRFRPAAEMANIFSKAREDGYRTYMFGSHHPYHVMLGDTVDVVRSTSYQDWLGDRPWHKAVEFSCLAATDFFGKTLSKYLLGTWPLQKNCSLTYQTSRLLSHTEALIESGGGGKFAVIHLPIPHYPFCYDEQGPRKRTTTVYPHDSELLLIGQLQYTDRVIGDLMERLRTTGQFDNSTIIITSDHNWRNDPELQDAADEELTHVPLLVKLPNQLAGSTVDTRVATAELFTVLKLLEPTADSSPKMSIAP